MSEHETVALSRELRTIEENLDAEIMRVVGRRVPFSLLVFTDPRASYVSSARREDSVREIKHLLDLWEHGAPDVPAHHYVS